MPGDGNTVIYHYSDVVDFTEDGEISLGSTYSGSQFFHPLGAQIVLTSKSGTLTAGADCSIGTNDDDYNDIVDGFVVGGLLGLGVDGLLNLALDSDLKRIPAATEIKMKVTAAIGLSLVLQGRAIVYGFYL